MAKLSHFRSTWPTAHLMVLAAFLTFAPVADAITYTIRNYPLSQTRDGDSWTLFGSIITDGTLGTFTPEWDPVVEGWTTSHITGVSITISRPGESFSSSTEPVWLNGTINATAGRLTMGSGNFGMQGPGPVASGIRLYYSQSGADYEGCYAGSSNNWITAWATSTSDNTLGTGPGSI
ncbi:MAG: hypothetical protein ABSE63_16350, partial [Thermoguttaceae bacterium]